MSDDKQLERAGKKGLMAGLILGTIRRGNPNSSRLARPLAYGAGGYLTGTTLHLLAKRLIKPKATIEQATDTYMANHLLQQKNTGIQKTAGQVTDGAQAAARPDAALYQNAVHNRQDTGDLLFEPALFTGINPQLLYHRGRDKTAAHHSLVQQCRYPLGILNVTFTARHLLDEIGIDQCQTEPHFIQQVPDRDPVNPGAFKSYLFYVLRLEVLAHRINTGRQGTVFFYF